MEGMTFERGSLTFTLTMEDGAWVTKTRNPDYDNERAITPFEREALALFGMRAHGKPEEYVTRKVTAQQVLALLTPEECRLLLGYCSHLAEHGATHAVEVARALVDTTTRKDIEATKSLTMELASVTAACELVKLTATLIIETRTEAFS